MTKLQDNSTSILVRLPNWVGDVVMATPALRALRAGRPDARIVALGRPSARDLLGGAPWIDAHLSIGRDVPAGAWGQARALRRLGPFDIGLLMTNSLRSALVLRLGGVRRRIGYAREGRSLLLTDRVRAPRQNDGAFLPAPMAGYYARLLEPLGIGVPDLQYELFVTEDDRQRIDALLAKRRRHPRRRLAVINPGAAFGSAKCYPPSRFAEAASRLHESGEAEVVVVCGPGEREVAEQIEKKAEGAVASLAGDDVPLGMLKALVACCDVLITNDSGPRHFAAALGAAAVTIIGPTDRRWSESGYARETLLSASANCAPCMQRTCPQGHHRCMLDISPGDVAEAARRLLATAPVKPNNP